MSEKISKCKIWYPNDYDLPNKNCITVDYNIDIYDEHIINKTYDKTNGILVYIRYFLNRSHHDMGVEY